MKNHPLYKKLKQIALNANYSIERIQNASFNQVVELLGAHHFTLAFFNNMKRELVEVLRDRDDEEALRQLRQQTKTWLDVNFPKWEAERGRMDNRRFIIIWLEGKPEVANAYDIQ